MHDIRLIREDPAAFDAGLARRGVAAVADTALHLDTIWRARLTMAEQAVAERNRISGAIGRLSGELKKADGSDRDRLTAEIDALKAKAGPEGKAEIERLDADALTAGTDLGTLLAGLPNIPAPEVPDGTNEDGNVVVHEHGTKRTFAFTPREHFDFGPALGLDFESAQGVSGARFAYLRGPVARLARALGQFMLDVHTTEFGYEEVAPPLLVRDDALYGTGQLPKFAEDLFRTTDNRWLIPTAEVSLTNLVREKILAETEFPIRLTALTPCFRSEAGAAGRDTRGLIRQHQFDKVELVSIVQPEASDAEHERMTQAAETILDRLALPYRRMLLCAGDMGFTARKTYDLEVWLPGQAAYREISSCSNCGDFQARRMNARYRPAEGKGTRFSHTLNGSGVAVGRALVAVLENYQQDDGSVAVPEVLVPYMGRATRLTA
jgi:seryl-tRNA synthetase